VVPDPIHGARCVHEIYRRPLPATRVASRCPYCGQADSYDRLHESADIIRMMNSAFDGVGATVGDYYPTAQVEHRQDQFGDLRAGSTTASTRPALRRRRRPTKSREPLFATLDRLELCLASIDISGGSTSQRRIAAFSSRSSLRSSHVGHFSAISDAFQISQSVAVYARALPVARCARDGHFEQHQNGTIMKATNPFNPTRIVPMGLC